jgi:dUTP pyrophosphatase
MLEVRIKKLHERAVIPAFSHPGDAGFDFYSIEDYTLLPGVRALIRTGLAVELPRGYELQVRPRSGLALKKGVTVLNSPGTIDSGYRGEIGIIIINHGEEIYTVSKEHRVAQGVITRYEVPDFILVNSLSESERGSGSYGSSGV